MGILAVGLAEAGEWCEQIGLCESLVTRLLARMVNSFGLQHRGPCPSALGTAEDFRWEKWQRPGDVAEGKSCELPQLAWSSACLCGVWTVTPQAQLLAGLVEEVLDLQSKLQRCGGVTAAPSQAPCCVPGLRM